MRGMAPRELTKKLRGAYRTALRELAPVRRGQQSHGLPWPLVVSLTSYRPRFPTLHLAIKCLLSQSVRPDHIVLWVARDEINELPRRVQALRSHGLEIRSCDDLRSYKKIIPSLESFPDAAIVTADDDSYYERRWLAGLVDAADPSRREVLCYRSRRISYAESGSPNPYRSWPRCQPGEVGGVPIGVGGVLYPPGALPAATTDRSVFMDLCPTTDDLWLFWMLAVSGTPTRTVTQARPPRSGWVGAGRVTLSRGNMGGGGNDRAVAHLAERFGLPPAK